MDGSNLFWWGPNNFGQVQIIKTSVIGTWPKWFGPDQNDLDPTKIIWTVQNHFGPIKGQGIRAWMNLHVFSIIMNWEIMCNICPAEHKKITQFGQVIYEVAFKFFLHIRFQRYIFKLIIENKLHNDLLKNISWKSWMCKNVPMRLCK